MRHSKSEPHEQQRKDGAGGFSSPTRKATAQMKKRTVITTEKREVWIVREGAVQPGIVVLPPPESPKSESLITTLDDSDQSSTDASEKTYE